MFFFFFLNKSRKFLWKLKKILKNNQTVKENIIKSSKRKQNKPIHMNGINVISHSKSSVYVFFLLICSTKWDLTIPTVLDKA